MNVFYEWKNHTTYPYLAATVFLDLAIGFE